MRSTVDSSSVQTSLKRSHFAWLSILWGKEIPQPTVEKREEKLQSSRVIQTPVREDERDAFTPTVKSTNKACQKSGIVVKSLMHKWMLSIPLMGKKDERQWGRWNELLLDFCRATYSRAQNSAVTP